MQISDHTVSYIKDEFVKCLSAIDALERRLEVLAKRRYFSRYPTLSGIYREACQSDIKLVTLPIDLMDQRLYTVANYLCGYHQPDWTLAEPLYIVIPIPLVGRTARIVTGSVPWIIFVNEAEFFVADALSRYACTAHAALIKHVKILSATTGFDIVLSNFFSSDTPNQDSSSATENQLGFNKKYREFEDDLAKSSVYTHRHACSVFKFLIELLKVSNIDNFEKQVARLRRRILKDYFPLLSNCQDARSVLGGYIASIVSHEIGHAGVFKDIGLYTSILSLPAETELYCDLCFSLGHASSNLVNTNNFLRYFGHLIFRYGKFSISHAVIVKTLGRQLNSFEWWLSQYLYCQRQFDVKVLLGSHPTWIERIRALNIETTAHGFLLGVDRLAALTICLIFWYSATQEAGIASQKKWPLSWPFPFGKQVNYAMICPLSEQSDAFWDRLCQVKKLSPRDRGRFLTDVPNEMLHMADIIALTRQQESQ